MTFVVVGERAPVHREVLELDVGVEAGRHAHDDFVDAEQERHARDRVDLVVGNDHQRCYGAAVVLADLDDSAEQFLFGRAENLTAVARRQSFFGAHAQRDQLRAVALGKVAMEMGEVGDRGSR